MFSGKAVLDLIDKNGWSQKCLLSFLESKIIHRRSLKFQPKLLVLIRLTKCVRKKSIEKGLGASKGKPRVSKVKTLVVYGL